MNARAMKAGGWQCTLKVCTHKKNQILIHAAVHTITAQYCNYHVVTENVCTVTVDIPYLTLDSYWILPATSCIARHPTLAFLVITLDIFQTGVTSVGWQMWLMETSQTIT